jgi:hypothetical protein
LFFIKIYDIIIIENEKERKMFIMKKYDVDLIIGKTYEVFANSIEEAKDKAISAAREEIQYNSLCIEDVIEENDKE